MTPFFFQRRFWPMWTALSLGAFADNVLRQALIIGIAFGWVRAQGFADSRDAIPIVGSFFAVAMLVFSAISGQIAEKYETARLFRLTKFAEVVLMAIAALGFALNSGALLIATLFAMGAQSAFFSPVRLAAMPKYLKPDELVRGNGLCNAGLYVSILLGLFFGGLMIAAPGGGMRTAALLISASFLGWLAVLFAPRAAAGAPELRLGFNPVRQVARMFGLAFSAPGVARPLLGAAFFFYASTLVTVLIPLYVKESLRGDEAAATAIMGLFAVGAGAGALGAAGLAKGKSGLGLSGLGISLAALGSLAAFGLTHQAAGADSLSLLTRSSAGAALFASFVIAAAGMGLFVAPLQAAAQRRAPAAERARILAASNMLNAAAAIAGSLSVLLVTRSGADPAAAFPAVAGLQAAVALYMLGRRTRAPRGLHDEMLSRAGEKKPAPTLPGGPNGG